MRMKKTVAAVGVPVLAAIVAASCQRAEASARDDERVGYALLSRRPRPATLRSRPPTGCSSSSRPTATKYATAYASSWPASTCLTTPSARPRRHRRHRVRREGQARSGVVEVRRQRRARSRATRIAATGTCAAAVLETSQFPTVELAPTALRGLTLPVPTSGSKTFQLVGDLTVHGVTKPTTWQVDAKFDGGRVSGTAATSFVFSDFGLTQPRVPVVLSVADTHQARVHVLARAEAVSGDRRVPLSAAGRSANRRRSPTRKSCWPRRDTGRRGAGARSVRSDHRRSCHLPRARRRRPRTSRGRNRGHVLVMSIWIVPAAGSVIS